MQLEEVAKALKELGHPTRLFIFKHLVSVGLVRQNRESRTLLCVSQYAVLEEIIAFFQEECCVNSPSRTEQLSAKAPAGE